MYLLTNGKEYVMENPYKYGDYRTSTSPNHAKHFTFKQARSLLQNSHKGLSWIHSGKFYMLDLEKGKEETKIPDYSLEGVYIGENCIEFDPKDLEIIQTEIKSIIGLAAWNREQLTQRKAKLLQGLSYYDSAISDIDHARMDHRPPAHVMTKIDKLRNELKETRRDIKQSLLYIDVMIKASSERWSLSKIKAELSKSAFSTYKGRTKYYDMILQLMQNK